MNREIENKRLKDQTRGSTLLEGMVASCIFLLGMVGVIHATVFASTMNSDAVKRLRANAISSQLRVTLQTFGHTLLTTAPNVLTQPCSTDAAVIALAGGLGALTNACVIDLDSLESSSPTGYTKLMRPYSSADRAIYRRILVVFPKNNTYLPPKAATTDYEVTIVLSWMRNGARRYLNQLTSIPDPRSYDSGTQI